MSLAFGHSQYLDVTRKSFRQICVSPAGVESSLRAEAATFSQNSVTS